MKTKIKLILPALLIAGFFLVASCGNSEKKTEENTQEYVVKKQYTCSMHPEVIQDEPGSCPTCKMELIEKEDESHEGHNH